MGHNIVVSVYPESTGIPWVDGLSMRPLDFGASQLGIRAELYEHLGLGGHGFRPLHSLCISVLCSNMLHYCVLCVV